MREITYQTLRSCVGLQVVEIVAKLCFVLYFPGYRAEWAFRTQEPFLSSNNYPMKVPVFTVFTLQLLLKIKSFTSMRSAICGATVKWLFK